jgi:hypothetical protein
LNSKCVVIHSQGEKKEAAPDSRAVPIAMALHRPLLLPHWNCDSHKNRKPRTKK